MSSSIVEWKWKLKYTKELGLLGSKRKSRLQDENLIKETTLEIG